MFGSKQKAQREADIAAVNEAYTVWFDAMEKARPTGLEVLTTELIEQVGNPYAHLPPRGTYTSDSLFYLYQAFGREWAARLSRKTSLSEDSDASSRSEFWQSVNNWL
jgi:hypothetical protein